MASRLLNEGPNWVFLFLWVATNIGLFIGYFLFYKDDEIYIYLNEITGLGVPFARASAAALNFDCLLILLPVCRNLVSFLRGSLCSNKRCRSMRRLLDKNITFHKLCAYMICFWSAIHYWAHTFNFEYFIEAWDKQGVDNQTRRLLRDLSEVGHDDNTWVNPVDDPDTNPMYELVTCVPGLTGLGISLALILMVTSSTEVIRRSYFEVFWYTHHLFVVFFACLVTHGLGNLVRGQANLDKNHPDECSDKSNQWGDIDECEEPEFAGGGAKTWYWVLAPMVLYFVERCIRFWRSQQKTIISKVVKHPSKVIELQMQKKGFKMESGQYIFLHCPSISRLEWHPFTLTSAPEDDYFSVHVRLMGDWTNALFKACLADEKEFQDASKLPSVAVDGPFGTASDDVFTYDVDILVAAGIGVTPFASVLKDIWYKYSQPDFNMRLRKIYVYWICPDTNAFEWFADLLKHLEHQMAEQGKAGFLDYHIYLTRGWDQNQALNIAAHEEDIYDVVTGLKQKTYYGRPNWDQEFSNIAAREDKGTKVGVFFCGPKVLSTTLHKMCNKYTEQDDNNTTFVYNKENF